MRSVLITLGLLVAAPVGALETDNYISWGHELRDSAPVINEFFNAKIRETLPRLSGKSCQHVTDAVAKNFASYLVHDDPIAQHLMGTLSSEEMYPTTIEYVSQSIYRDPYRFYIPKFGLAPNVQVNARYFGMDKLSHFGATGKHYLDAYLKVIRTGGSEADALTSAIDYGVREENTLYGYWASGVYSFADLEANFQGFRFYQQLCHSGERPFLARQSNGDWLMVRPFDVSEFVNANWDETFNPSYLLAGNWKKVQRVLKERYCPLARTADVLARFDLYRADVPSFSVTALSARRERGDKDVPNPQRAQSFEQLCR